MTNASVLTIYMISLLLICALCLFTLRSRRNSVMHPYYLLLSSCLLIWLTTISLYFIIPDPKTALFFHEMKFIGTAFAPLALLLFMVKYLRMEKIFQTNTFLILCIIPLATSVLALTNDIHHLFREVIYIVQENPRTNYREQGIWFWLHTIYSYVLIMVTVLLLVFRLRKTPGIFRMPLIVMMVGVGICVFANASLIILDITTPIDLSLIGFSLSMIFVYWAMMNSNMTDYITLAHDEIINTMENAIFILDQDRAIVSVNRAAEVLCEQTRTQWKIGQTFAEFLETLQQNGAKLLEGRWSENADISVSVDGQNIIYSISEHGFTDRRRMKLGTVMTLQNITQIRRLIHNLELTAGFDPLTGIYNRLSYEEQIVSVDTPGNLPIAVIMGDVNNLKEVNDDYGHEEGDDLLRAAAEAMTCCMPQDAATCRIGGDEFIMLIPRCTLEEARALIDRIRAAAAARKDLPYAVSIALGCACKTDAAQELRDVIHAADMEMYVVKEADPDRKKRRR